MRRVLSCPAFVQPGSAASARQAVVAHSMPDLLAAAIFVPPQRLLECVMHGPAGAGEMLAPFSQRGVTVPVSASAPDLAMCLATPDPMASREEDEEDEEEDEVARRLARTLAEERAEASRRRQRRLLFTKLRGGPPRRRLPRG